jgi:hypothetical protein
MRTDNDNKLSRALGYPYPAGPWPDYLFDRGQAQPLPASFDLSGRVPVLAVGSNRSPEQLVRKYQDTAQIPVTRFELVDHDVAYCAYMTHYGSMPATLVSAPGTRVTLAITWLTQKQLSRMHETESVGPHTRFGWLHGLLAPGGGNAPDAVLTYISARGLLTHGYERILLTDVNATGRAAENQDGRMAAMGQQEVLALTWQHALEHLSTDPGQRFEEWLLGQIDHPPSREQLNGLLQNTAVSSIPNNFEPVDNIIDLPY